MATAAATSSPKKGFGIIKAALGGGVGLATGVVGMYATAIVDKVAKPPKPLANFSATTDGLTATFQNQASGQSGWWDFGDGTALEPFDAAAKQVPHTYAKLGSYNVKLVVRNFLNEENERSIEVNLTNPTAGPTDGPSVANLTVEPIGNGTAPATFRIKCELKNAQQMILDPGTDRQPPEVITANGPYEKLVVYEQPGQFPLQIFALNGAKLNKQWKAISVKAPATGALSVIAVISDSGTKSERKTNPTTIAIPIPAKPAGPFDRTLVPDPGFAFAEAKLGAFNNPAVKNLKVELAPDKRTAKLSGEWTGSAGSELLVPLQTIQEKSVPFTAAPQRRAAPLVFSGSLFDDGADWNSFTPSATIALPAAPAGSTQVQRKIQIDLHEMGIVNGQAQDKVIFALPSLTKAVEEYAVTLTNGEKRICKLELIGSTNLRVTISSPRVAGR